MKSLHFLQAQYWQSPNSFLSAKEIVQRKCRNSLYILKQYLAFRTKNYPDQAATLQIHLSTIISLQEQIPAANDRQSLFLVEAQASRAYWQAFALLAHCPTTWRRFYPRAPDYWNKALNIAYTMLANIVRERLKQRNLSLEIGVLHSPQVGHEALVYDLEELFRQPMVDASMLAIFSRNKKKQVDTTRIIAAVSRSFEGRIYYDHGFLHIQTVFDKEFDKYISALKSGGVFYPYQHSWAHRIK